jgi:hypothetical protein
MQIDLVAVKALYADTQKNGQVDSNAEPNSQFFNCFVTINKNVIPLL